MTDELKNQDAMDANEDTEAILARREALVNRMKLDDLSVPATEEEKDAKGGLSLSPPKMCLSPTLQPCLLMPLNPK